MSRHKTVSVMFGIVVAGCFCSLSEASSAPQPSPGAFNGTPDPAGRYLRKAPSRAELVITPAGSDWRVDIVAGGLPRGGGTAADCRSVGVGPQVNGTITAQLVPFDIDGMKIDAEDLKDQPGRLVLRLRKTAVEVVASDAERFCGLGSMLMGVYRRVR